MFQQLVPLWPTVLLALLAGIAFVPVGRKLVLLLSLGVLAGAPATATESTPSAPARVAAAHVDSVNCQVVFLDEGRWRGIVVFRTVNGVLATRFYRT